MWKAVTIGYGFPPIEASFTRDYGEVNSLAHGLQCIQFGQRSWMVCSCSKGACEYRDQAWPSRSIYQGEWIFMVSRSSRMNLGILAVSLGVLGVCVSLAVPASAQERQTPYQVAERPTPSPSPAQLAMSQRRPDEHPLMPALRWAQSGQRELEQLADYSATLVKQERINGKLCEHEFMFVKVRHQPFSVYMRFLAPNKLKGQEVIYVEGANDGKLAAHGTGMAKVVGTLNLDPTSMLAMRGNLYPITELGVLNLVRRLLVIGERDAQYGECEVKFHPGATIEERACTCIEVMHPVPRRNFLFHIARIYVDDELNIPVRYEAYNWPEKEGGRPVKTEEYTYLNLKLNNGFTDADFDIRNPNYEFGSK